MAKIIGSFYLKPTEGGGLHGEYTNNQLFTVSAESAILVHEGAEPFLGRYHSTWEEHCKVYHAELVITYLENAGYAKYKLVWYDAQAVPIYEGEALLAEGMLIGHYISLP